MANTKIRFLIFFFLVNTVCCLAQTQNNETENQAGVAVEVPAEDKPDEGKLRVGPGMEVVKIGEANIVVPKGTKVQKEGSKIVYEDMGEYIGRRLYEIEKRLEQTEMRQGGLEKEMGQLKEALEGIRKEIPKEKTTQDKE